MVNKTAIAFLSVIVVASLGVGILVGMQLAGPASSPANAVQTTGETPTTATPTSTSTGDDAGNESGATATPVDSESPQHTEIPARQFNDEEIAAHVVEFVNEERQAQNQSAMRTGDATASKVSAMASAHSVAMADNGSAGHTVDGVSTSERYRNNDLFDRCKFKSNEGSYISQPDEEFELVGTTYAGVVYDDDGQEQFNGDERAVARAIVDGWLESSEYTERLLVEEPTRMGVGIEVTSTGTVYATVDVCA